MTDIKANLVELSGSLGLNLTSEDTRIKHTKTGELNISSNGTINIEPTVKLGVTTNTVDIISDNINITAKNFTINSEDETVNISSNASINLNPGFFSITTKNISEPYGEEGNGIEITSGNGSSGQSGGQINITAGASNDVDGADIYITGGYAPNNKGGNISLVAGNGLVHGDVTVNLGTNPDDTRECGRLIMENGPLKLAVYATETIRNTKIKNPQKGDMCLLEASTAGTNLIHYYNGTVWKAIQNKE